MFIESTEIIDTFAEAFAMWGSRVVITGETEKWAMAAARSMTGFATSVIGCKCEAGIERKIPAEETPDGRPGVSVLLFAGSPKGVGNRLVERIGQCVMTCPTTACYNGLEADETVNVGGKLRYFGDGYQASKVLGNTRLWRIPVMEGEFVIEESFGVQPAVGGGNFLVLGQNLTATLNAVEAAVEAMQVPGAILPFPDGVVRSGSKPGSRYKALPASTNDAYCPSLRGQVPETCLPDSVSCVLEIVIDGLDEKAVAESMRRGIQAAAGEGIVQITAGNYGGNLGQFHLHLHEILQGGS
ncbi:MAG: formylmethanofuran--tetrahydromethanopterin N-formyltransferase [Methylothermaceae bacteria B42]|nr:MAG: formylmethanofuran--tetrahydromethanopterin N-formyltransferase [Methylothermaceae bacteria B42]HHJ38283.1 formylmethanofuran--tetrahydromethanopterin N-formyltransferase [Methylothermaceae bacterium]